LIKPLASRVQLKQFPDSWAKMQSYLDEIQCANFDRNFV